VRQSHAAALVLTATVTACGGGGGSPGAPASLPAPTPTLPAPTPLPVGATVDALVASCPSAAEVRQIDADLHLSFEGDPTAGQPLRCTAAAGSADLTPWQERVYNSFRAAKLLSFDAPLPWTQRPIYQWLAATVQGIRLRTDTNLSFCCSPARVINISVSPNSCLLFGGTRRWVAVGGPCGMDGFLAVVVHEARHAEGPGHTCGTNDNTIAEMGAWAVQYWFLRWIGEHAGSFLTPGDGTPSTGFYRDVALAQAQNLCSTRFCQDRCP
jgi:hypothetical protein